MGEYRFPSCPVVRRACQNRSRPTKKRAITTRKGVLSTVITFFREEDGQGLVEYALIIAVIAIAVIVAMLFLRGQIQNIFSNIGNNLT